MLDKCWIFPTKFNFTHSDLMPIQNPLRCIILWFILIIAMILHFNYHVGEIFYGIDVTRENADGTVPIGTAVIRNIFYHFPIIWILVLMTTQAKIVRLGLFILSLIYTLAHGMHLAREFAEPDISQISLLTLTLGVSVGLAYEHFRYWKQDLPAQDNGKGPGR